MASEFPRDSPPAYEDHSDFDDIDTSVFNDEQTEENVTRKYKKKADKKKSAARERSASTSSVRVQLNKLSDREVDDATMETVFGEDKTRERRNSMKLNPLFDQNGTVEVTSTDAEKVQSENLLESEEQTTRKSKTSSKPYKKSKKRTNSDDDDDGGAAQEPKIAYSKNFRFKGPSKQNGLNNGQAGPKKLTTGRIMPSRISRNAIPGSQIMASLSGKERPKQTPEKPAIQQQSYPDVIETVTRRSEIRKKWRLVIALILIILFFALILVVVLYFASKAA